eukprot:145917-Prorocentrum_minimum.AAC.2
MRPGMPPPGVHDHNMPGPPGMPPNNMPPLQMSKSGTAVYSLCAIESTLAGCIAPPYGSARGAREPFASLDAKIPQKPQTLDLRRVERRNTVRKTPKSRSSNELASARPSV